MTIQFPEFVGRDEQLSAIYGQVDRGRTTVIVNIAGVGGIGKTTILRKIRRDMLEKASTLVTQVIDFSQTAHRVESWVLEQIVSVSRESFQSYTEKMRDIEALEPLPRLYRESEAFDAFVSDFNELTRKFRVILLFDTVELVQETPLLEFILDLVERLENTVLILAGRHSDDSTFVNRLRMSFTPDRVLTLRLGGFTKEEADLYFDQAVQPSEIEVSGVLRSNIYELSAGNAIKIALSLDWLSRGIPLMTDITLLNPDDLVDPSKTPPERLADLRGRFEYALMDGVRRLQSDVSEVVLYMAHLDKRCNRSMLEYFFFRDLDPEARRQKVDETVMALRQMPFVKYVSDDYFVLHDEMVRLVIQHVWDLAEDPDKSLRRELSREACAFYDQELGTFPPVEDRTEQQRITHWSYSVERMYYNLYADFQSGYHEFERLFEALVDDHRSGLAALTVKFLKDFKGESEFSRLLECFAEGYYDGGVLLSQHKFEEAERTLTRGLARLQEAIAHLDPQQASALDRRLFERQHEVYHQFGFCYRSMGNWEKARQNYERSLQLALDLAETMSKRMAPTHDQREPAPFAVLMAQVAETLNSLANVDRLVGNLHEARLMCQTSLLLRQTWAPDQVTRSQYVMGMILWEMGGTTEAMRYLYSADESCPPEDETTRALIAKYRANILYRAGLSEQAVPILEDARAILYRRGQFSELADALNMLSRIYRDRTRAIEAKRAEREHLATAMKYTDEAHSIAKRIGDQYRLAECYLTRSLHLYRASQLDAAQSRAYRERALEQCNEGMALAQLRYYQLMSQFSAVRGDIFFDQHDYDRAFQEYYQQCALAARFKRATYERAIDHIGDRLRELGTKDSILARRYIHRISETWRNDPNRAPGDVELLDELDEIRKASDEKEELSDLRQKYQQSMHEGKWTESIVYCDRVLQMASLYSDVNRARAILDKIRAVHRLGHLATARRLAKAALQIGIDLQSRELVGEASLLLAHILWDATSTAEAADHLARARKAFDDAGDEVNLARVKYLSSYILHRTGFFQEPIGELLEAAQVFEQRGMPSELAEIWNLQSRIARTDPEDPDYEQARQYAERALRQAQLVGDHYRIAECYLSLAFLAFRRRDYDGVLQYYEAGAAMLSPEMHLLRSVYESIQGIALFEKACTSDDRQVQIQFWDRAFEAFAAELIEATQSKPARLMRALDLVYEMLMRLPPDRMGHYSERLKKTWRERSLINGFPIVMRMCDLAVQYRPYIQVG